MAREALGIVGAAAGFVVSGGNPIGASIGFAIGSGIGGYVDPIKVPAPGLGEAPIQTGRDGVPLPIPWGMCHCHGNIIQSNPIVETSKWKRQGKGGSTKVQEIRRYRTFAIGVCTGPISGFTRIWENDKLVYDTRSSPAISAADSAAWLENTRFYLGTDDQLPDPDLEANVGVGNCPSYRGTAYMVRYNMDVTDFGSAIPQYRFEINGSADATVTSKPYPIEITEGVIGSIIAIDGHPRTSFSEGLDSTITPQSGDLLSPLNSTDYDTEGIDPTITPQDGGLKVALHTTDYDTEGISSTITPQDGLLEVRLISYEYEEEGIISTITPQDGQLT